ncbi:MAG: hypothetical protein QOH65_976 [Methylobacteriaceae bacterium]|nr:hypothetical protein [Methylobacteriaceae bacterium]
MTRKTRGSLGVWDEPAHPKSTSKRSPNQNVVPSLAQSLFGPIFSPCKRSISSRNPLCRRR